MNNIRKFRNTLLVLSACLAINASAQLVTNDPPPTSVFTYVNEMPKAPFNVGAYIGENIHYPDSARVHNITGRVIVRFIVNEDGHISDCKAMTHIGDGLEEEAIRVISGMPDWAPGRQKGVPVKVYFTQPITFKLDDAKEDSKGK